MSFPVPIEYDMNDAKDNTIVKYNNGDQWEGLPSPAEGGGGGGGLNENMIAISAQYSSQDPSDPRLAIYTITSISKSFDELMEMLRNKIMPVFCVDMGGGVIVPLYVSQYVDDTFLYASYVDTNSSPGSTQITITRAEFKINHPTSEVISDYTSLTAFYYTFSTGGN